jgi:hypothetical protein
VIAILAQRNGASAKCCYGIRTAFVDKCFPSGLHEGPAAGEDQQGDPALSTGKMFGRWSST